MARKLIRTNGVCKACITATNTPHFNNPNGSFGSPTFGQVTGSFGERFLRFGTRVTF